MSVQIVSPKRNKSNFCQLLGQQQQKPLQNTWSVMCNISDLCVCILRYLCCGVISTEAPVAFHLQVAECWDILSWSSSQGWKLSGLKSQILPKDFCSAASCQALLKKKKKRSCHSLICLNVQKEAWDLQNTEKLKKKPMLIMIIIQLMFTSWHIIQLHRHGCVLLQICRYVWIKLVGWGD